MSTANTGLEVGKTLHALGRLVEASEAFIAASKMPPKPKESGEAKNAREESRRLAEELGPRIPSIVVRVTGVRDDEDLVVKVDGESIPRDSLGVSRKVDPGSHHVEATAHGVTRSADVKLSEHAEREAVLSFPAALPSETKSAPVPSSGSVPETSSTWPYVGYAMAGVGLAVGAVGGIGWILKNKEMRGTCPNSQCEPPAWPDVDAYNRWRAVTLISAGVFAVGSAIVLVTVTFRPSSGRAPNQSVTVGPNWIGWQGRF